MAKSNNTLLNTHFQNENSFLISECDRTKLVEVCDLLKLFICFSGSSKELHLDSTSFSDVIEKIEEEIEGVYMRAVRTNIE